ncbi:MAG: hypothetical protein ACRDYB_10420 [Acidimicrobiales bacterium]
MIFTRISWVLGLMALAAMLWLAIIGLTPFIPILVTAIALLVLVGGGNFLNGRSTPSRSVQDPAEDEERAAP